MDNMNKKVDQSQELREAKATNKKLMKAIKEKEKQQFETHVVLKTLAKTSIKSEESHKLELEKIVEKAKKNVKIDILSNGPDMPNAPGINNG